MKPKPTASKRTKARFKHHAPFKILADEKPACFDGLDCLLLQSIETKWFGWIPKNELEID